MMSLADTIRRAVGIAATAVLLAMALGGCVQVGPKTLGLGEKKPAKEAAVLPLECPRLEMPPPIPSQVHIVIEPGQPALADDGGEQLIRSYAATRDRIRALWP